MDIKKNTEFEPRNLAKKFTEEWCLKQTAFNTDRQHFVLITSWVNYLDLFQRILIQKKILVSLVIHLNLLKNNVFVLFSPFLNFEAIRAQNGFKKLKCLSSMCPKFKFYIHFRTRILHFPKKLKNHCDLIDSNIFLKKRPAKKRISKIPAPTDRLKHSLI